MAVGEGEGDIGLCPQLWCTVRDCIPVLADETQVYYPLIADGRVRLGVILEDLHQNLSGEPGDWSGLGDGISKGNVMLTDSGHLY